MSNQGNAAGTIRSAVAYGFLPGNTADDNARALQAAVDEGGVIVVDVPGTYEISQTINIGDDTTLKFGEDVYIKRALNAQGQQDAGYAFINKGAYDRVYNRNISIIGLKLICNGLEAKHGRLIRGLRGHVVFFYIRNLIISDFECLNLLPYTFAIQICTFENILVEKARIEGLKDGVHLGYGRNFVIRHCQFRTFDDPVALNAHDYVSCVPEFGWIENGLVEDCYDLDDKETTGFFCRILGGSWVDWFAGMNVQQSDTVVSNGRLYRVDMANDGKEYVSKTAPTHTRGTETYDGIRWLMLQERIEYQCGCRNVRFKNIHLKKKRNVGFCFCFDDNEYSRSYYPNSRAPVQDGLVFENIVVDNEVPILLEVRTSFDSMKIVNSRPGNSRICLTTLDTPGLVYPGDSIVMRGTVFSSQGSHEIVHCEPGRKATLTITDSVVEGEGFCGTVSGDVEIRKSDIPITSNP